MNAAARQTEFKPAVPERVPHRFTVDEMWALQDSGALGDARVELIEGELVDMPADGPLNVDWSMVLGRWLYRSLPDDLGCVPGLTLRLSDESGPKPDWWVCPIALPAAEVTAADVRLAIEQSDTSVAGDLGWKAKLYASFALPDYWVVDLQAERIHVHREPTPQGYASVEVFEREHAVEALLIPGLVLRLSEHAPGGAL